VWLHSADLRDLVGAYNGLRGWAEKYGQFVLKPAHECHDMQDMFDQLKGIDWPADLRILLTGKGRVANGAVETLTGCWYPTNCTRRSCKLRRVVSGVSWTSEHYYRTSDGKSF